MGNIYIKILALSMLVLTLSCGSNDDDLNTNDTKTQVIDKSFRFPCISWGEGISYVEQYMSSNNGWKANTVSGSPEIFHYKRDFLEKNSWGDYMVISYEFVNDSLKSSVSLLQGDDLNMEIIEKYYIPDYEFTGNLSSTNVYTNEQLNTMAAVYRVLKNNKYYYAICLSSIN